jgi:uncharacterized protein with FMN-binding domain
MSNRRSNQRSGFTQTVQKLLLSGFVLLSFAAYVIHQRFTYPDSPLTPTLPVPTATNSVNNIPPHNFIPPAATSSNLSQPTAKPFIAPATATPLRTGQYKDGVYTGPQIDAYYGMVEVQATIQNGRIASVQFLQYPSDRRTSQRINSIAMPWLQQEAIQAQSANVNLISGATLTSEAFVYSLDAALQSARN